ncbi:MAG: hypothetical protein ACK5NK_07905 [Niabella sp.]
MHKAFLIKYIDNPRFSEIFITGNYNCATASALYAFILDKIGIAYQIRETPTHVYIVADPAGANVLFETTTPGMKSVQMNEKFQHEYLNYLQKNKIITEEEARNDKKSKVFEKYF